MRKEIQKDLATVRLDAAMHEANPALAMVRTIKIRMLTE
jgi:hypothetical protein